MSSHAHTYIEAGLRLSYKRSTTASTRHLMHARLDTAVYVQDCLTLLVSACLPGAQRAMCVSWRILLASVRSCWRQWHFFRPCLDSSLARGMGAPSSRLTFSNEIYRCCGSFLLQQLAHSGAGEARGGRRAVCDSRQHMRCASSIQAKQS